MRGNERISENSPAASSGQTSPRRGRPPRGDGAPYAPYNRLKFWILTALEEIGEAPTHVIATWYEARVLKQTLEPDAYARLSHTIKEKCRRMATEYSRVYVTRRQQLIKYPGEELARNRWVYKASAYGKRRLQDMREGRLAGAPYQY